MELTFLIFSVLMGISEVSALLAGYLLHQRGIPSPRWLNALKLIFFCAFFGCWLIWNLFRNLP
ncbi:MAG: hypothetical protein J6B54_03365 [Clostridia bacterium]|nr:hypothetical protein [Clostridia bacterium]